MVELLTAIVMLLMITVAVLARGQIGVNKGLIKVNNEQIRINDEQAGINVSDIAQAAEIRKNRVVR